MVPNIREILGWCLSQNENRHSGCDVTISYSINKFNVANRIPREVDRLTVVFVAALI